MADDNKKLTTEEILARARAEAGGESGDSSSQAEEASSPEPPASPEAPPEPQAPSATPGSTADILAAARAQAAGGGEAPAEAKQPPATTEKPSGGGDAPKSTSDILAAARAQAGGGGEQKPAGGGAAPGSTSDILAAARAQAGKGAAPASEAPAKKTSPKAKAAEAPAGELPPVKEMVEAMKSGRKVEERKPEGPPQPKIPSRPPKTAKSEPEEPRRNFLLTLVATPFALGWTLMVLLGGLGTLYIARFMMPNVLNEPPSRFKIGPPSDYAFGTVATKWKSQFGIWVVHTEYKGRKVIYALLSVCTHLGCTPNWLEGEQKFKCPCHGSGFYITGINFEGPAPRPLERAGIALGADGMLEVDKSVKFQEELGQWNDGTSYVEV